MCALALIIQWNSIGNKNWKWIIVPGIQFGIDTRQGSRYWSWVMVEPLIFMQHATARAAMHTCYTFIYNGNVPIWWKYKDIKCRFSTSNLFRCIMSSFIYGVYVYQKVYTSNLCRGIIYLYLGYTKRTALLRTYIILKK